MNYLDLFSGIGGFRLGLEQGGFKFGWTGHSEIDKYAKRAYENHFESEGLGDVRSIRPEQLPRINLITFGFPCQDLSVAGKRAGLDGERSGLFFEAMRIIEHTKPDIFIFENVKGLLSSNEGQDFKAVLQTIADLGLYECEWQLLNTRWFLPQNRERIYFIGHLRGRSRPKVFPIGESNSEYDKGLMNIGKMWDSQSGKYYNPDGICPTIERGGIGNRSPMIQVLRGNNKGGNKGNICPSITGSNFEHNNFVSGIRRLTPTECARLQGFPDDWCEGLSDTQQYKCYGNTVSVPAVKAIGERIRQ
jgi:DNA (cytosine-5)-methyltransferase 1